MVKESALGKQLYDSNFTAFVVSLSENVSSMRPRYHLSEPNHYNGDVSVCPGYVESMPSRWMGWNDSGDGGEDDGVEVVVVAAVVGGDAVSDTPWLVSVCKSVSAELFDGIYCMGMGGNENYTACMVLICSDNNMRTEEVGKHVFLFCWQRWFDLPILGKIKQCTCLVNLIDAPFMLHGSGW